MTTTKSPAPESTFGDFLTLATLGLTPGPLYVTIKAAADASILAGGSLSPAEIDAFALALKTTLTGLGLNPKVIQAISTSGAAPSLLQMFVQRSQALEELSRRWLSLLSVTDGPEYDEPPCPEGEEASYILTALRGITARSSE